MGVKMGKEEVIIDSHRPKIDSDSISRAWDRVTEPRMTLL